MLAIWDIRPEKSEKCATQSRTDKPLLNASTDGYLGNEAERGRLLFVGEGDISMCRYFDILPHESRVFHSPRQKRRPLVMRLCGNHGVTLCWLLGLSVRELANFLVETGEMRVQSRWFLLNFFSGDTPFITKESFYWYFVFSCA